MKIRSDMKFLLISYVILNDNRFHFNEISWTDMYWIAAAHNLRINYNRTAENDTKKSHSIFFSRSLSLSICLLRSSLCMVFLFILFFLHCGAVQQELRDGGSVYIEYKMKKKKDKNCLTCHFCECSLLCGIWIPVVFGVCVW